MSTQFEMEQHARHDDLTRHQRISTAISWAAALIGFVALAPKLADMHNPSLQSKELTTILEILVGILWIVYGLRQHETAIWVSSVPATIVCIMALSTLRSQHR